MIYRKTPSAIRNVVFQQRGMAMVFEAASTQSNVPPPTSRKSRAEGDISSVFASLSGEKEAVLPERFVQLKRDLIGDEAKQARLVESWKSLNRRLAQLAPEIERKQQDCIPQVTYEQLIENPSKALLNDVKRCGTLIVKGTVSEETALQWLEDIKAYIKLNPEVKGFPADNKQVFELYWSKAQLAARSHPRSVAVQRALLKLFSAAPDAPVSLDTPLLYADRLRIRQPGDAKFALGPHMDGGSLERWEDPEYRKVYSKILDGKWEEFDAWQIESRAKANQDIYHGSGSCGVFRAFQGWTSLSSTGPKEGTLRVFPYIREQTAYTLVRPLFKEKQSRAELGREDYLAEDNWEIDTQTSRFPGSPPGRGQEMNDETHPHLQLDRTMVSIPKVQPGDQAWWHADTIHAVESIHQGKGPSAVMYIPAVPLTLNNIDYIRDQKECFLAARPPPDFPGGVGESSFKGTGRETDIPDLAARNAMGLSAFEVTDKLAEGERYIREEANRMLGFQ